VPFNDADFTHPMPTKWTDEQWEQISDLFDDPDTSTGLDHSKGDPEGSTSLVIASEFHHTRPSED
jgi:hypothetical protein